MNPIVIRPPSNNRKNERSKRSWEPLVKGSEGEIDSRSGRNHEAVSRWWLVVKQSRVRQSRRRTVTWGEGQGRSRTIETTGLGVAEMVMWLVSGCSWRYDSYPFDPPLTLASHRYDVRGRIHLPTCTRNTYVQHFLQCLNLNSNLSSSEFEYAYNLNIL